MVVGADFRVVGSEFRGSRDEFPVVTGADFSGVGCEFPDFFGTDSWVMDSGFRGPRTDLRAYTSGSPGLQVRMFEVMCPDYGRTGNIHSCMFEIGLSANTTLSPTDYFSYVALTSDSPEVASAQRYSRNRPPMSQPARRTNASASCGPACWTNAQLTSASCGPAWWTNAQLTSTTDESTGRTNV